MVNVHKILSGKEKKMVIYVYFVSVFNVSKLFLKLFILRQKKYIYFFGNKENQQGTLGGEILIIEWLVQSRWVTNRPQDYSWLALHESRVTAREIAGDAAHPVPGAEKLVVATNFTGQLTSIILYIFNLNVALKSGCLCRR